MGGFYGATVPGNMLAGVHPEVGRDAQGFGIRCVLREDRNAHGGADAHHVSFQLKGIVEELGQGLAHARGILAACGLLQDHGKLVAAGASHRVGAAHPAHEDVAYALEQLVADVMPDGVVDLLEMIQIDQEQSGLRPCAPGALKCAGQAVLKETAVGQSGQFVMQSQVLVVLDLIFKKQQNHAHGNDILGQIPDLALEMEVGGKGEDKRPDNENACPGKEPRYGDEGACRGAPVGIHSNG